MRRIVVAVVVLGFIALLASIAFGSPMAQWIVVAGYTLFGVVVIIGLFRRRGQPRDTASELSASDDYSDLQLGRTPITHYPRYEASSSQVGDPPTPPRRNHG